MAESCGAGGTGCAKCQSMDLFEQRGARLTINKSNIPSQSVVLGVLIKESIAHLESPFLNLQRLLKLTWKLFPQKQITNERQTDQAASFSAGIDEWLLVWSPTRIWTDCIGLYPSLRVQTFRRHGDAVISKAVLCSSLLSLFGYSSNDQNLPCSRTTGPTGFIEFTLELSQIESVSKTFQDLALSWQSCSYLPADFDHVHQAGQEMAAGQCEHSPTAACQTQTPSGCFAILFIVKFVVNVNFMQISWHFCRFHPQRRSSISPKPPCPNAWRGPSSAAIDPSPWPRHCSKRSNPCKHVMLV